MPNRFQIIPAVYLILVKSNKVLLMRRFNTGYMDGYYSMIAGHLEGNETLQQAVSREAFEEAGIIVDPKRLQLIHVMHTRSEMLDYGNEERIDFYFSVSRYDGQPEIKEPDKCDDMRWFDLAKLPEKLTPRVRQALGNKAKNIMYSDLGW